MSLTFEQKQQILQQLDTKKLITSVQEKIQELYNHQKAELVFVSENRDYLAGRGDLCREAKMREAELRSEAASDLKAVQIDAWLLIQRREDPEFKRILNKQTEVEFQLDQMKVKGEHLRRQITSMDGLIALRTAQINFLASK